MNGPRYLCSELVRLAVSGPDMGGEQWANLEEIWLAGAVLDCESEVKAGGFATIRADRALFEGRVMLVEREEFGWRVEIAFSPGTPWKPEEWMPAHALDPETLRGTG